MNISIMGDSISTYTGHNPAGYAVFYDHYAAGFADLSGVEDTWWMRVANALNGTVIANDSFSGSLVSGKEFPAACKTTRLDAIKPADIDPDLVLLYIGINDFGYCAPLGNIASEPAHNGMVFYDAYRLMLDGIRQRCPSARVVCATLLSGTIASRPDLKPYVVNEMGHHLDEYNEVIRKAATAEGAEIADLAANEIFYDSLDGVHPTRLGHETIANIWLDELARLSAKS